MYCLRRSIPLKRINSLYAKASSQWREWKIYVVKTALDIKFKVERVWSFRFALIQARWNMVST